MARREQRSKKRNRANDKTLSFENAPGYAGNNLHTHLGTAKSKHLLLALISLKRISASFWEKFVAMKPAEVQRRICCIGTNTSKISFKALSPAFGSNHTVRVPFELPQGFRTEALLVNGWFASSDRCVEQCPENTA